MQPATPNVEVPPGLSDIPTQAQMNDRSDLRRGVSADHHKELKMSDTTSKMEVSTLLEGPQKTDKRKLPQGL